MLRQKKEGEHTAQAGTVTGRASGTVIWFIPEKRFGFIRADAGDEILFVHFTFVKIPNFEAFAVGTEVVYIAYEGYLGLEAHEVRPVDSVPHVGEEHENR